LGEVVPTATTIGVLSNPSFPQTEAFLKDLQVAAVALGRKLQVIPVTTGPEIDAAFGAIAERHVDALLVSPDPLFLAQREQIVTLAASHAVPVIYQVREFPAIGGLMSYETSIVDAYRQVGVYVGRILKGEKPADLPVMQPTKFELVINLKTAKALGLTIPETLLATADEVIQL
jgi:putative ABC transport system substrate-binding protein